MPKIIGLTGGIATGKTQVSNYLKSLGISVIDADIVTRQVESKGQPGLAAIIDNFGDEFLNEDGELDRQRFGNMVFSSKRSLTKLIRVINPFIEQEIYHQIELHSSENVIVLDAPTLFENGYNSIVDEIVLVYADPTTQLTRLMNRNQLATADAMKRIASQWSLTIKQELADVVFYNSGEFNLTKQQIDNWIKKENFKE
ncbi:dephospho-CoA kinase [Lentilactobacillus sp. SPB1-3]|uniref:Dephospho-CoA kinase n=1 Tax=Lentilactobacillus terminaliae TaxID=3003483 RepID=A0ACD5DH50_9LACO|nr:dephospho-CoA kinase [Lentilactobacillus sp. SPB1-3]MCZ0977080.1 dephospho-CoA kinase [Lentilactobacillus sp. SPB1-3]